MIAALAFTGCSAQSGDTSKNHSAPSSAPTETASGDFDDAAEASTGEYCVAMMGFKAVVTDDDSTTLWSMRDSVATLAAAEASAPEAVRPDIAVVAAAFGELVSALSSVGVDDSTPVKDLQTVKVTEEQNRRIEAAIAAVDATEPAMERLGQDAETTCGISSDNVE